MALVLIRAYVGTWEEIANNFYVESKTFTKYAGSKDVDPQDS